MKKQLKITYLKKATKFLSKNSHILKEKEVDELIIKFVKKRFYGIDTNIDFKQMQGSINDIYRIRKANIKIIVKIEDDEIIIKAIVKDIGYRGDVYK